MTEIVCSVDVLWLRMLFLGRLVEFRLVLNMLTVNLKHWDCANLRQGTSYQCCHLANQYE